MTAEALGEGLRFLFDSFRLLDKLIDVLFIYLLTFCKSRVLLFFTVEFLLQISLLICLALLINWYIIEYGCLEHARAVERHQVGWNDDYSSIETSYIADQAKKGIGCSLKHFFTIRKLQKDTGLWHRRLVICFVERSIFRDRYYSF